MAPVPEPSPYIVAWPTRADKATLTMAVTGNTIALDPAVDDPAGTIGIRAENREGYDDLDVTVTGNTLTCRLHHACLAQNGDTADQAREWLSRAVDQARDMGMAGLQAEALASSARLARASGQNAEAVSLFDQAKSTAAALGWLALEQRINAAAAGIETPV